MTLTKLIETAKFIASAYECDNVLGFGVCGRKSIQYGEKFPSLFPDYNVKKEDGSYYRYVIVDDVELFQLIYEDELIEHDKQLLKEATR